MAANLGDALKAILQVPGLQEMLNSSITNEREVAPLRTAVRQQAANMLPNAAFSGGRSPVGATPANFSTPAPPPDSGPDWAKILAGVGVGLGGTNLLLKLFGGGDGLLAALKKLFGGATPTPPPPPLPKPPPVPLDDAGNPITPPGGKTPPVGGNPGGGTGGSTGLFPNTDPFNHWGDLNGGKPLPNTLFPNAPEDPRHD